MSLLGFITGVGSIIGAIDGKKTKTSQSSSGSTQSAASGSSSTTGKLTNTSTQNQNQTSNSNQSQTGTVTNSGTTSSAMTGQESQQSQSGQQTTMFSSDILASLDSLLKQQLTGGSAQQATDAVGGRLQQIQSIAGQPQFNVDQFVSGIATQAEAATQNDLDSRINQILSASGGSETGNSMNALLGNKLRNDAAANLSGIVSGARAQGTQIAQQQEESRTQQIATLGSELSTQLSNLINASAGASQNTTGQQTSTGTTQQTGTESSMQKQIQDLLTSISQSQQGTTTESSVADQTQETKESQIGTSTENTVTKGSAKETDLFNNIAKLFSSSQLAA